MVHWSKYRETTNAKTSNQTSDGNLIPFQTSTDLDDDTNAKDEVPEDNRCFATKGICDRRSDDSTTKGSDRELYKS